MMKHFLLPFFLFFFFQSVLYATVRVMPLGDSITYDDSYADQDNPRPASVRHAYRNYLYYRLRDAKYSVDFVGSRIAGTAVSPSFDPENEGYPGETTDYIGSIIYNKLRQNPADIILLHIGTNDRWRIDGSGNYMGGIHTIFSEIDRFERDYHRTVRVIVALIIGRRDNDYGSFTNTFNANLRNVVNDRIGQGDRLTLIDMQHNAGLNYHTDFRDPAHPTNGGYNKMSVLWYNTLKRFLPNPNTPPNTPSALHTSSVGTKSATLSWSDNASNEKGFKVYKGSKLVATLPKNTTHYTITDLEPRQSYTYKVIAYNDTGNSSTLTLTFKTKDDYGWLPAVYHSILY